MSALIAFVPLGLEYHLFKAFRADNPRAGTHITALQAVVKPAMFVYIEENVTTAAWATFGFPFRHPSHSMFEPGKDIQDNRDYDQ
jgi:hypothetical protein